MAVTTHTGIPIDRTVDDLVHDAETAELVGFIGHELRTPLASVMSCAELLESADDPTERSMLAATMRRHAKRLMLVFEAALQTSRVWPAGESAGRANIRDALCSAAEWLTAFDARLRVRLHHSPRLRDVAIEPDALHLVLNNLAVNAAKHARGRTVSLSAVEHPGAVELIVEDDGSGVPAHLRETVFEPCAKGRDSDGHGLGLYVARRLVRGCGGDICVGRSKLGGAAFHVLLPVAEARHD